MALNFPVAYVGSNIGTTVVLEGKRFVWNGTSWVNQNAGYTGSRGATGTTGAQGPAGAAGAQGPAGPIGYTGSASTAQGPAGPVGYTGSRGAAGTTGAQGPAGGVGYTGSQGPAGPTGPGSTVQGPLGYTGSRGIQGVQGGQGVVGFTGSQGIQGVIGYTGSRGLAGSAIETWAAIRTVAATSFVNANYVLSGGGPASGLSPGPPLTLTVTLDPNIPYSLPTIIASYAVARQVFITSRNVATGFAWSVPPSSYYVYASVTGPKTLVITLPQYNATPVSGTGTMSFSISRGPVLIHGQNIASVTEYRHDFTIGNTTAINGVVQSRDLTNYEIFFTNPLPTSDYAAIATYQIYSPQGEVNYTEYATNAFNQLTTIVGGYDSSSLRVTKRTANSCGVYYRGRDQSLMNNASYVNADITIFLAVVY